MNILFVSHLSGKLSAGPCWSVPARVKAQSVVDNVFWLNWGRAEVEHWVQTGVFHKSVEFGSCRVCDLPVPFNKPDYVVFEGFYSRNSTLMAKELDKIGVPYIVNPRGSLTKQARNNGSKWKKNIAHLVWFDHFVNHSKAIQYLTKQECDDTSVKNHQYFILPNGFNTPTQTKTSFSEDGLRVVFIGRIDIYHKGLDLLMDAVISVQDELRNANVHFDIYGPSNEDLRLLNQKYAENGISDLFEMKGETTGIAKEKVLLDADVFILTSRFEGHPMGLIEALSYGLPALVTVGSNMKEEIEHADAGWACDTSIESIRNGLLKMIEERARIKAKSENAKQLASQYKWEKLAKQLHEQLESFCLQSHE